MLSSGVALASEDSFAPILQIGAAESSLSVVLIGGCRAKMQRAQLTGTRVGKNSDTSAARTRQAQQYQFERRSRRASESNALASWLSAAVQQNRAYTGQLRA